MWQEAGGPTQKYLGTTLSTTRQVSVSKQGFPRIAINPVLRYCLREPSGQNLQAPAMLTPSLWERDSPGSSSSHSSSLSTS